MSVRQSKGARPHCGRCPSRLHEQDAQVDHKSDETGLSQRLSIASHQTPGGTCRKGPIYLPHSSPSRPVNSGTPPTLAPVLPRSENSFGQFATLQDLITKRKRPSRSLSTRKPGTDGMFSQFFDEWKLVNVPSVPSFSCPQFFKSCRREPVKYRVALLRCATTCGARKETFLNWYGPARTLFSPKLGLQAKMRWCNIVPAALPAGMA